MTVHHRLLQRATPPLRIDARLLQPAADAGDAVLRMRLPLGRDEIEVGELFTLRPGAATDVPTLEIEGDLSRFDHLGLGLVAGELVLRGSVGHGVGMGQAGGRIVVHGHAKDLAGCSLRGGWLEIHGDVGDLAASALPGDMDGMRGGTFVIHGRAGQRLGDRMRRGTLVVHGDVGDLAASRMVAGTIALGGRCGAHLAWGMRRGSVVLAGGAAGFDTSARTEGSIGPTFVETIGPTFVEAIGPTFVRVRGNADVFWQLLARDLARFGGAFASLPSRRFSRMAGDLAVQGKGEVIAIETRHGASAVSVASSTPTRDIPP
jgi:formylmethanofuran dehydrogenase subunit C